MRVLVEKEIRLLLPAFAAALVLAIVPVWLPPADDHYGIANRLYMLGVVMLALSSFGREISLKTIPFLLAQPLERKRIWWTKVTVLTVFLVFTFAAWSFPTLLNSMFWHMQIVAPADLAYAGLSVAAFTASGLWMTLLLRQVAAAFWLTLLIPIATDLTMHMFGAPDWVIYSALVFYAVAGFFLARRQFLHLQDTAWTGGVISLGRSAAVTEQSAMRQRRPWGALFRKELQLHQFTLAGIATLFVLHLGVVVLRKVGADFFSKNTLFALEMFGGLWIFVPLLAGSQSVAEERQLGTLDGLLSLPFSRRVQFTVKLLLVLVIGGLVSAALLCGVEKIGRTINPGAGLGIMGIQYRGVGIILVFLTFLAISLISFYASTLTRSVVQAMAAGVVAIFVLWALLYAGSHWNDAFGWRLWPATAVPGLTVAVVWLAYGNFRWQFETGRRWRRNIFGIIGVTALICGLVAAIYQRTWEYAVPLEAAPGLSRLSSGKPALFRGYGGRGLAIVLPDGRLWVNRFDEFVFPRSPRRGSFVSGSNWVDAYSDLSETVGIRSDGTLWVSEKLGHLLDDKGMPLAGGPPSLIQFGVETNWQSLQHDTLSSVVLLKQDGTLWRWGRTYETSSSRGYQGLRSLTSYRLGTDSDWARMLRGEEFVYAWKKDGQAWALREAYVGESPSLRSLEVKLAPEIIAERVPWLDHIRFLCLAGDRTGGDIDAGVRDDGTLWYWIWWTERFQRTISTSNGYVPQRVFQIGLDSNWVTVASGFHQLTALKSDGSIWRWNLPVAPDHAFRPGQFPAASLTLVNPLLQAPQRMGTRRDWIALGFWRFDIAALAADGTLWRWPRNDQIRSWSIDPEHWLVPSRRPTKIENILDAQK